jgi:hypothetical protein
MKHIKFSVADPIIGIQRLRNIVFMDDEHVLNVAYTRWAILIKQALIDAGIKEKYIKFYEPDDATVYFRIRLRHPYHFEQPRPTIEDDEIIVFKDYDNIWLEDALGNHVGDIDIDNPDRWIGIVPNESECYNECYIMNCQ